MSPRLRPGLVIARRDDQHLQVGLEPPRRAVLRDQPEVRRLLDDLQQGRVPDRLRPAAAEALARLERAGLLVARAGTGAPTTPPVVSVTGPSRLTDAVLPLLTAIGIDTHGEEGTRLLLAHGALHREATDPLVREGVPHLVAVMTPWGWEVGPFVLPGVTACLRCVDATLRESDPRHGVVLDQVARDGRRPFLGPAPDPALDPVLAATTTIAAGWIARDLLAHARADRPTTWSATIRLDATPAEGADATPTELRRWLRHPHCGCAWDALAG